MLLEATLSQLAEINPSRPKIILNRATNVSFIPMSDVSESGRWIRRQSRQLGEVNQGYTYFCEGDILFAKITPCTENGKGCYANGLINGIGFASTEFHVLRAKDNADAGFIYQWSIYKPLRMKAAASMTGSAGQQRVPASFLDEFKVPAIPKLEQTKILSTMDRAIEQSEALIAKQQRIKAGLMQDLLTRGIDGHGNLRSEDTHRFKDSPLGRIPEEWVVEKLSVKVIVKGGKRLPAGHNYAEGDTNFRYLRTMDFINKPLIYASLNSLFPETFRLLERYEIKDGDVFLSIAGVNLGVAGVFRPDFKERTILTENSAKLSLVTDEIPEYLSIQLNGPFIQKQILEVKGIGAGVPKLALHRIQSFDFPWPTRNEQVKIVKLINQTENYIEVQYCALKKLHSLKTALMQDLLTGKRRVTALLPKPEEASA